MKRALKLVGLLTFLILVFAIWYKCEYSMDVVSERTINSPELSEKLLIATQGSDFKDRITQGIVDHFKSDSIFIRLIDISILPEISLAEYDAAMLMHTWENWEAPESAAKFLGSLNEKQKQKVVVLITSGSGDQKIDEVDAITGESNLKEVNQYTNQVVAKLSRLMEAKQ